MRKCAVLLVLTLLLSSVAPALAQSSPDEALATILARAEHASYKPGELLVKLRAPVLAGSAEAANAHRGMNARVLHSFEFINVDHVALPEGVAVTDAITRYMQNPDVEYAEPNYIGHVAGFSPTPVIPDDPDFGLQWAWQNTGLYGTPGADVSATLAWDITTGSRGVAIAILDSGADYTHPDLKDNLNLPLCQNFSDSTTGCDDYYGHGTHVTGIAGAEGNNGIGVAGLMWKVDLIEVKFIDDYGIFTNSEAVQAIDYVIKLKDAGIDIKAINASWGLGGFAEAVFDAFSAADKEGILVSAAAGNEGVNVPDYPAGYKLPNVISAAATDYNDQLASDSNYGSRVDVAAPGVDIFSTAPTHPNLFGLNTYAYLSGTSMAAAVVSGLIGLLATEYPGFTPYQIRGTILRYVDVLPSLQGLVATNGRINAYKALSSLLPPTGLTVSPVTRSGAHLAWTDNATGEDGYTVERSQCYGPFSEIAVLGADHASYNDASAKVGATYMYRVRAFNTIPAHSEYSNLAIAGNLAECPAAQ